MTYIPLTGAGLGADIGSVVLQSALKVLLHKIVNEAVDYAAVMLQRGDNPEIYLRLFIASRLNSSNLITRPILAIVRMSLESMIPWIVAAATKKDAAKKSETHKE